MTHATQPAPRGGLLLAVLTGTALFTAACGGMTTSPGATPSGLPSQSASTGQSGSDLSSASPSGSGSVGGASASPAATSDAADDPCALVTADDAGTLLGTGVAAGQPTTTDIGSVCRYVPADGTSGFAVVTILSDEAGDAFERAVSDFSLAELEGIGDAAAGVDGTVVVSSGETTFSLVAMQATFQPVSLDGLTAVARDAVERLGNTNTTPAPSASGEASPSASP